MSYTPVGLGYILTIDTPLGKQKVDVDVEGMTDAAIERAWPQLLTKAYTELPNLVAQAGNEAMVTIWPKVQTKVRAEGQTMMDQGIKRLWLVAGVVVVGVWGAALWSLRKKR
jgi:hypothetical protein